MNAWIFLAFVSLALAAIPCGLFLSNLFVYRPLVGSTRREEAHSENAELETRNSELQLEPPDVGSYPVSVLIPARNEEASIRAAAESVLAHRNVDLELLVLDDHSTDRTAEIVRELAAADTRVRLIAGEPLPAGWCGKQFACHTLAQHARRPLLVFMDADVRLTPDALKRMAEFVSDRKADLASGVPRQFTGTFLERLLIPLIHFVLLGFLPMIAMRRSVKEKFAAGCGQLFIARRDAYFATGGHAAIRASLHDGVKLPRAFRRAGFRTDLFDATDLARCRMYQTNADTWRGLGKNATEGLGAPGVLPVMTALLLGGQVLSFVLLAALPWLPANAVQPTLAAALCAWIPRLIAVRRFRQSIMGALLHPLGVTLLLAIQWQARLLKKRGVPMSWKGRDYVACPAAVAPTSLTRKWRRPATLLLIMLGACASVVWADEVKTRGAFSLEDQLGRLHTLAFPRASPTMLVIADRAGAEQINGWIAALKERYGQRIAYAGVADVRAVPGFLRGRIRSKFKDQFAHPVMLDWSGRVVDAFGCAPSVANVFILDHSGTVRAQSTGPATPANLAAARAALDQVLATNPPASIRRETRPRRNGVLKKLTAVRW
jgi:hypothetical protein